jgi:hypothetical protein
MRINFTIDARRLQAARERLEEVIHVARQSDESDDYWAGQLGMVLLQADFEAGASGLQEDPPFYWEKVMPGQLDGNKKTIWTVNYDDSNGKSRVLLAFHSDDSEMSPSARAAQFTERLNRVVHDWLFRRTVDGITLQEEE